MPSAKPNILFIMGDDIGWFNRQLLQSRHDGLSDAQYRPDRRGRRAVHRLVRRSRAAPPAAPPSSPASRRSAPGSTKVGLPGADLGLGADDPCIAQVLKAQGYATGQFGKNHLGDRDEHLPTMHGFDEFFGNLYHLNAEEEPENRGLSEGSEVQGEVRPARRAQVQGRRQGRPDDREHRPAGQEADGDGRRGVPRRRQGLHQAQARGQGTPWFCYFNSTRMHVFTHLKKESQGKTGLGRLSRRHGRA